jgi:BASS family bile acid:Na+ symporter
MSGPIPDSVVAAAVALTLFTVMFGLGLGIPLRELRWAWHSPGPIARGLFAMLVAAPAIALAVTRVFDLPRFAEIGIVLMAIAPGAPLSLRRSLGAGGHRSFAPSLQILAVSTAALSMPVSIAILNHLYGGHATVAPGEVARQVLIAQLAPLGLGMAIRQWAGTAAGRIEPLVRLAGPVLLVATVAIVVTNLWEVTVTAGGKVLVAIAIVTVASLAAGHLLGGADPSVRTALAFSCAARNPGLALLVATQNAAPPQVNGTILAYLMVSVLTIVPYELWRRRVARGPAPPG